MYIYCNNSIFGGIFMADKRNNVKIPAELHERMKSVAKLKNCSLYDCYIEAINNYLKGVYQEEVLKMTLVEKLIKDEFRKMDRHLSSMLGRTGMDVSMVLMGLCLFLRDYFTQAGEELPSIDDILTTLRKEGAKYFKEVRLMDRIGSENED